MAAVAGAGVISLVLIAMAGCASAGPAEGPAAKVGTMLVRVEWPEASAELVPAASQSVEVIISDTDAGTTTATRVLTPGSPTALIENLEAGINYTVSASAYPESDASGTAQATGTTTKTIVADQVNTVNLSMASTITSVSASPSPSSMEVGGSVTLTPQAANNEGTTVLVGDTWTFSSDKTGVATVNAAGQVSGVAEGAAGITVTESESGVSAEVLVLVIGSEIVWGSSINGNLDLYKMKGDGSNQTRLTTNAAHDNGGRWSPDGTKIVFDSERDGNAEIYTINADGTNPTRLTNDGETDWTPAWSPDGTKIAFRSNRDGDHEIYVMDADGSNVTQLTDNTATDGDPHWSPDGTKIVFTSNRNGNNDVFVMGADGSSQTALTTSTAVDGWPCWSPDGTKIVFQTNRDGNDEIYTMDADGGNKTRLTQTDNSVADLRPYWGTGGIVWDTNRDGGDFEIYRMNADGTHPYRLTQINGLDKRPAW